MLAVGSERQGLDPGRSGAGKWRVKMREKLVSARNFVFERRTKPSSIHGDQDQTVLAGKMLGSRFPDLLCRREMNETIGQVHRGAVEFTIRNCFLPQGFRADLVDQFSHGRAIVRISR